MFAPFFPRIFVFFFLIYLWCCGGGRCCCINRTECGKIWRIKLLIAIRCAVADDAGSSRWTCTFEKKWKQQWNWFICDCDWMCGLVWSMWCFLPKLICDDCTWFSLVAPAVDVVAAPRFSFDEIIDSAAILSWIWPVAYCCSLVAAPLCTLLVCSLVAHITTNIDAKRTTFF